MIITRPTLAQQDDLISVYIAQESQAGLAEVTSSFAFPQVYMQKAADTGDKEEGNEQTSVSTMRIAGELLGGVAGGLAGSYTLFRVISEFGESERYEKYERDMKYNLFGIVIGSSIGVHAIGSIGVEARGWAPSIYAGGMMGWMLGVSVASNIRDEYAFPIVLISSAIGATIEFNLANRYKLPKSAEGKTPQLSMKRIAGEMVAGWLGGSVGSYVSFSAMNRYAKLVGTDHECADSWQPSSAPTLGFVECEYDVRKLRSFWGWVWGIEGTATSVYAIGTIGNETGSLGWTRGGAILGYIAGTIAGLSPGADMDNAYELIPIMACPVIGATIAFNLTRRYKTPSQSGTALINIKNGQVSLSSPSIYVRPDPCGKVLNQYVYLVRMRF